MHPASTNAMDSIFIQRLCIHVSHFSVHLWDPSALYCFQLEAMDHQIAEEMGKLEELENGENKM